MLAYFMSFDIRTVLVIQSKSQEGLFDTYKLREPLESLMVPLKIFNHSPFRKVQIFKLRD